MNGFIRGDATTNSINIFTVVNVTMTHRFMRVDGQSQPSIWIAVISSMRTMAFVYAPNVAATQVTNFLNSFHMCAEDFFSFDLSISDRLAIIRVIIQLKFNSFRRNCTIEKQMFKILIWKQTNKQTKQTKLPDYNVVDKRWTECLCTLN